MASLAAKLLNSGQTSSRGALRSPAALICFAPFSTSSANAGKRRHTACGLPGGGTAVRCGCCAKLPWPGIIGVPPNPPPAGGNALLGAAADWPGGGGNAPDEPDCPGGGGNGLDEGPGAGGNGLDGAACCPAGVGIGPTPPTGRRAAKSPHTPTPDIPASDLASWSQSSQGPPKIASEYQDLDLGDRAASRRMTDLPPLARPRPTGVSRTAARCRTCIGRVRASLRLSQPPPLHRGRARTRSRSRARQGAGALSQQRAAAQVRQCGPRLQRP